MLDDGSVFDDSYKRGKPSVFPVNGVIKGWQEGLQLMKVGSKFKLIIPPDLAYGKSNHTTIPSNSTLTFEIELLEIEE
jgi:FKBP-type peptidyl-prolyl cis-trans isomerase FkpA